MLRLLSPLIISMFKQELCETTQQAKRGFITCAIIGIFAAIGFVFLLLAGFIYLSTLGSPLAAALIMAAGAFIVALVAWLIIKSVNAAAERKRRERLEADKSAFVATASLAAVEAVLKRPILAAALPLATMALTSLLRDKKNNDRA
ncbi:phage holin family protein [Paenochrobactrum pullorum]|uniref:phage holin family protein n=1 Tax=Paenochrobactrum pullorum TaxID=1324351 RepID=UPI0035BBC936